MTNTATINTAVAGQINKSIWVDGTKYPVTQAGIQQAFTDACAITGGPGPGTDVYLPPMSVGLFNVSGQQFLVTCNLHIHGVGDYATQFVVAAGVGSGVPVFRFQPNNVAAQSDILIEGIEVVGNTSGGDAFFFDGTNVGMTGPNNFVIRKTRVHGLSAGAWAVNGSGNVSGLTQNGWNIIENNTFLHGINLGPTWAVDSWLILHNVFGSDVGNTTPCVNASTANNGASHITLLANNGGCNGGFFISHGTHECKILYNQIEQPHATTEVNSAIIDLIGDTFTIDQCEIRGNNIGPNNFATIGVRVGTASGTIIGGNTIGLTPVTGVGMALTAGSSGTFIETNNQIIGVGGGAVAITNATGVNPFTVALPKLDGTLPARILNATDGGVLACTNGGQCWTIVNGGVLFSPLGQPIALNGTNSGVVEILVPDNGGTAFVRPPDVDSVTVIKLQVASDFTLAANTSLQTITGLTTTLAANVRNFSFHCSIDYSQATAAVSDAFGIQVATNAPTNVRASGIVYTSTTASTAGVLSTLTTTTATNIVAFTPSGTATVFTAVLNGTIELPAAAHTINFMASQSNLADLVTIKRGSYCQVF